MRRRIVAAAAGLALLIIIVLVINGCLKSQKSQALKDYNRQAGEIAQEYEAQVAKPLFTTLAGAAGKSGIQVQVQVNVLLTEAQKLAARARSLSVPGELREAQRDFLLALDLRVEGITKIGALLPTALGGQSAQAAPKIAGDMELFLASDVIVSQRVVPLIQQTLSANSIQQSTAGTRFLPNLGWLETNTVTERLTGQSKSGSSAAATPGTHGSALTGTAVGTNQLQGEPTLNHIAGGGNPTFTVTVENTGESAETNVKVEVDVTAGGKSLKASKAIPQTQPGQKTSVEIPVGGVPIGVAAKISVDVAAVPGETNTENNKQTYLAIFGE
jgi:CARDB